MKGKKMSLIRSRSSKAQTTSHPNSEHALASMALQHGGRKRDVNKKSLFIVGGVVIAAIIIVSVVLILAHQDSTPQTVLTPQQQAAESAKQANDAATTSADKGDTSGALTHYHEALTQYQKAGNKAGEEGVKLQLKYYEVVKAQEDKQKSAAVTTTETP
jgi:hypothetical protein